MIYFKSEKVLSVKSSLNCGCSLQVAGVDFPTSVLIAAASSALGTTSASLKDVLRLNPSNTATACIPSGEIFYHSVAQMCRCTVKPDYNNHPKGPTKSYRQVVAYTEQE